MTAREWKPGDVALIRVGSEYPPEVAVHGGGIFAGKWYVGGPRYGSQHGWYHDRVEVIRPLIVIDPESDDISRLIDCLLANGYRFDDSGDANVAQALREFANPTPSEPTDPKARVEDRRENVWRLLADGDWVCTSGPDIGEYLDWSGLTGRGPLGVTL